MSWNENKLARKLMGYKPDGLRSGIQPELRWMDECVG